MSKKEKTYAMVRFAIVFLTAAGLGFSIVTRNIIGAIVIFFIGLFLFMFMKRTYKEVVISDERTQKISDNAIKGAFWIYLASIALADFAVIFLGPLDLEIIDQIKPAVNHITYTFFFLIFLYETLRYYYNNNI